MGGMEQDVGRRDPKLNVRVQGLWQMVHSFC